MNAANENNLSVKTNLIVALNLLIGAVECHTISTDPDICDVLQTAKLALIKARKATEYEENQALVLNKEADVDTDYILQSNHRSCWVEIDHFALHIARNVDADNNPIVLINAYENNSEDDNPVQSMRLSVDDLHAYEYKVTPNGNLEITMQPWVLEETKAMLANATHMDFGFLDALLDVTEWRNQGFLYRVLPEDIGALTDAPIIGTSDFKEGSEADSSDKVWWYPDYAVTSFAEILIETGKVVFTAAPEDNKVEDTLSFVLPAYLVGYIFNGNEDSLTSDEVSIVSSFIKLNHLGACLSVGDSHFAHINDLNEVSGGVALFTFSIKN